MPPPLCISKSRPDGDLGAPAGGASAPSLPTFSASVRSSDSEGPPLDDSFRGLGRGLYPEWITPLVVLRSLSSTGDMGCFFFPLGGFSWIPPVSVFISLVGECFRGTGFESLTADCSS